MKRQRTGSINQPIVVARANRPIDKQIINVARTLTAATQGTTILYSCVYPATVTGILWNLTMTNTAASSNNLMWALIVVKQGDSVNALSQTDTSVLYAPEQECLAWGTFQAVSTGSTVGAVQGNFVGKTKTMRKLGVGDTLRITFLSSAASTVYGDVQFFLKS